MASDFYLWGEDRIAGHSCPAITAGYDTSDTTVRSVAEMYDMMASHYPTIDDGDWPDKGIIEGVDAQQAWLDTLEILNERMQNGYDEMERLHTAALIYRDEWGDN